MECLQKKNLLKIVHSSLNERLLNINKANAWIDNELSKPLLKRQLPDDLLSNRRRQNDKTKSCYETLKFCVSELHDEVLLELSKILVSEDEQHVPSGFDAVN